jgi:hypothetical protein
MDKRNIYKITALILLWLIPAAIFAAAFHYDWRRVWNTMGIHSMTPPFLDLRSIPAGVRTFQQGGDPLRDNPADPLHRPMNYPRVWMYAFAWLGITERNVWVPALLFCALYLACVSRLILQSKNVWDCAVLLMAGLSIAPLFAMERGNNDLFVFAAVFLGCMVAAAPLRAGAFLLATVLKVFPIVALLAEALRQRGRKRVWPLSMLVLGALLLAAQWKDLLLIQKGTPVTSYASYGMVSLKEMVWLFLVGHAWTDVNPIYVSVGTMAACYIAAAIIAWRTWRAPNHFDEATLRSKTGDLFFVFGSIYAATFAIGSNWDYRLIFLIPTLPLVLDFARSRRNRLWAQTYVVCILFAENCVPFEGGYKSLLGAAATVGVFLLILPMLVEQAKSYLKAARGVVAKRPAKVALPRVEVRLL